MIQDKPKHKEIEQTLVDEKWKSFNVNELVFGDLWRFLTFAFVQVLLIGIGAATSNVVVQTFLVWKRGMRITLCIITSHWSLQYWKIIQSSYSVQCSLHLMSITLTNFTYFVLKVVPFFLFTLLAINLADLLSLRSVSSWQVEVS